MAIQPKFEIDFENKKCEQCGKIKDAFSFLPTKSFMYPSGYLNICSECLGRRLEADDYSWNMMDKICQYLDIPFEPTTFVDLTKKHDRGETLIKAYNLMYGAEEYDSLDWSSYNESYKDLEKKNILIDVVPGLADERRHQLQEKWGFNYEIEELTYLENLYDGLLMTQNINGALQGDQALKICKISLEIDNRIRAGEDFDKLLASYDKLVKTGEFTPKNVKNASDFESMGELVRWLEKRGFVNPFYDGETRDIVDETITNIQSWNQRLYTNESGIGDEISQRIQALKTAAELETYYDLNEDNTDFDNYENDGFNQLYSDDDEFIVDLSEGE